jgi:phytoene dehydrogenase-like protein
MTPVDAVVVGAGPNGLAAAVLLARAGLSVEVFEAARTIGGGARTAETTLPGYRHDLCSAAHPMAVASPFFRAFDLGAHGVRMLVPEVSFAHPLDGGAAGIAWRDLDRTVAGLGRDGAAWRRLLGPLAGHWQEVTELALADLRSLPRHPATAARFGRRLLEQGSPAWGARFRDDVAPAMLTGVAVHAITPPRRPVSAAVALLLASLGHAGGWAIPAGGSQSIADALAADATAHGATIHTGTRIDDLDALPRARATLLDVTPRALGRLAGDRLPARRAAQLARFRYGAAVCKVDFALTGPVPWRNADCRLAGTLHLAGTRAQAVATAREVAAGRHPDNPYVLVVQPGVVDPSRAPRGHHTLYTYAHVPAGSTVDLGEVVTRRIERLAPGFRDLVLARTAQTAGELETANPNHVGGDISGGAVTVRQTVFRPTARWDPYATGIDGVYLCSSSTPPGPGVHGMCGAHAARRALRDRFGVTTSVTELLTR